MTLKSWSIVAGAAVAALVGAYSLGRYAQPAEVVTKTVEVEKKATTQTTATAQIASTDKDTGTITTHRVIQRDAPGRPAAAPPAPSQPCPACAPVHEVVTEDVREQTTSDEATTIDAKVQQLVQEQLRATAEQKTVTYYRPSWALELEPAWAQLQLRPTSVSGTVQKRIAGWLWLGAGVDYDPTDPRARWKPKGAVRLEW